MMKQVEQRIVPPLKLIRTSNVTAIRTFDTFSPALPLPSFPSLRSIRITTSSTHSTGNNSGRIKNRYCADTSIKSIKKQEWEQDKESSAAVVSHKHQGKHSTITPGTFYHHSTPSLPSLPPTGSAEAAQVVRVSSIKNKKEGRKEGKIKMSDSVNRDNKQSTDSVESSAAINESSKYDKISEPSSPVVSDLDNLPVIKRSPCPMSIKRSRLREWNNNLNSSKMKNNNENNIEDRNVQCINDGQSSCNVSTVTTTSYSPIYPSVPPPPLLRIPSSPPPSPCYNPLKDGQTDTSSNVRMNDGNQSPVPDQSNHDCIVNPPTRDEEEEREKCTTVDTSENENGEQQELQSGEVSRVGEKMVVFDTIELKKNEEERVADQGKVVGEPSPPPPPPQSSSFCHDAPGPGVKTCTNGTNVQGRRESGKEEQVSKSASAVGPTVTAPVLSSMTSTIVSTVSQTQQNFNASGIEGHRSNVYGSNLNNGHQDYNNSHSENDRGSGSKLPDHSVGHSESSVKVTIAPGHGMDMNRNSCNGGGGGGGGGDGIKHTSTVSPPKVTDGEMIPRGLLASTSLAQLVKLKRFLTTLYQFSAGISQSVGQKVYALIHCLVESRITIEDFHRRIADVTTYPLRPYVVPFLRLHLPILKAELCRLFAQSQQRRTPGQLFLSNCSRSNTDSNSSVKSNGSSSTFGGQQNFSNFIRIHEYLFLQSSVESSNHNQVNRPDQSNPVIVNSNNLYANPWERAKCPPNQKVVQIGGNLYIPNVVESNQTNHNNNNNLVNHHQPFEIFQSSSVNQQQSVNHCQQVTVPKPIAPKPTTAIAAQLINHPQQLIRGQSNFQAIDLNQLHNQSVYVCPTIVQQPQLANLVVNSQQVVNSQSSSQRIAAVQAMGVKDDGTISGGLKRKIVQSMSKENEKLNCEPISKSDHLRVSSGPRKMISPPIKINQPSSTIHYLPSATNHNQQQAQQLTNRGQCSPVHTIDLTDGNSLPKKMKAGFNGSDSTNLVKTNIGKLINGLVTLSTSNGSVDKAVVNGPVVGETVQSDNSDEEWNNIYVMLNCILGMVDKTKKALSILESRRKRDDQMMTSSNSGSLTNVQAAAATKNVGFNGNNNNSHNWSSAFQHQQQQHCHEQQYNLGSNRSSRPLSCSSSSGTVSGATALVPSTPCSSSPLSPPSAVSSIRMTSVTSNNGGSFVPLSASALYGKGSNVTNVISPRANVQQQLSPPVAQQQQQQSMISLSRTSSSRSPLVHYNSGTSSGGGQGTAAVGHHSSFESVAELKRQAAFAAEMKANELMTVERMKMERLLIEAKRKASEELIASMNKQEDNCESCWNCGRTANETCSGCNTARYCGSFCQHKHWDIHHRDCGRSSCMGSKSPGSTRSISP